MLVILFNFALISYQADLKCQYKVLKRFVSVELRQQKKLKIYLPVLQASPEMESILGAHCHFYP